MAQSDVDGADVVGDDAGGDAGGGGGGNDFRENLL